MSVRVKVCGITNLDDALAAVEAGADALGFIFFRGSPRFIEPEAAAKIIAALPPFVVPTGVFVDEAQETVRSIRQRANLGAVQLHGSETSEFCSAVGGVLIKAVRVQDRSSIDPLSAFSVSAFLLDTFVPGQMGGTGARFSWDLAVEAKRTGSPIILAGGLTPDNVGEAIAKVRPYGVDVSSGVESSPGRKDHRKIREFVRSAQEPPNQDSRGQ